MKASVFIATSLDGFIARRDGALDWLPAEGGEPHGYEEFIATVDAIIIGRKTFETVLTFEAWRYGTMPVVVLSSTPSAFAVGQANLLENLAGQRVWRTTGGSSSTTASISSNNSGRASVATGTRVFAGGRAGLKYRPRASRRAGRSSRFVM
jgi:dihydrofolate reductase